jgi:cytochrome c biogenesis protein CcdA
MTNLATTSLLLGLLATTSPCILLLYPGFLAYLSGQAGLMYSPLLKAIMD